MMSIQGMRFFRSGIGALLICAAVVGCSKPDVPPLYGAPTRIAKGQTPMDVVCAIQDEFKQLPKPLMERIRYRAPWTSKRVGSPEVRHRGFDRIHLRAEALAFIERHSRLELVASLTPLFTDADNGGEAAVLLAGIPAGTDAEQGRVSRALAAHIKETNYASPQHPGHWHEKAYESISLSGSLYGEINTTSRIHSKSITGYIGSLEEALVNNIRQYAKVSLLSLPRMYEQVPQPPLQGPLDAWIAAQSVPRLTGKARAFIEDNRNNFSALAVLPMMSLRSEYFETGDNYLMWMLGLEDRYWGGMLRRATGNVPTRAIKIAFRKEAGDIIRQFCAR